MQNKIKPDYLNQDSLLPGLNHDYNLNEATLPQIVQRQ